MEIFEFHFNPKVREDLIFDSFCYEPENIYERRLGSLYLVGELKNVLPQNLKLLNEIAKVIKEKYYTISFKSSEKALSESLKTLNEFLAEKVKKENVSWLGNLSLAILGLISHQEKRWEINFTKVGSLKIFLLRSGKITEISKNLEFQEIEPYPLKVFTNIVSGKLAEGDKILVLTKEVSDFFLKEGLLERLTQLNYFEEKKIKEVLESKKPEILAISGVLLAFELRKVLSNEIKGKRPIVFQPELKRFSFSQTISQLFFSIWNSISSLFNFFRKILLFLFGPFREKTFQPTIPLSTDWRGKDVQERMSKLSFTRLFLSKIKTFLFPQQTILIFLLLVVLFLGSSFSQKEKEKETKSAKLILEKIEEKEIQAESLLVLKKESQANLLFQEALKEILAQAKTGGPLSKEALAKKEAIEKKLSLLNKVEKDPQLNLVLEFKPQEIGFVPQKILFLNPHLYFFNPLSSKIYKFNLNEKKGYLLDAKKNLRFGAVGDDSIFFLSGQNILLSLKKESFQEINLEPWRTDFNFSKFSSFKSGLYFLDSESGEIVKYSLGKKINPPQLWLNPKTKKIISAKSMSIDGSIWILTNENKIERYFAGFYQETLPLEFWPYLENPTKIFTSETIPYLYLLEPTKKRIVILTKKGEIVKQFQSEEFDNLLDFAISEDGKTIFLLNGLKIYQIKTEFLP